ARDGHALTSCCTPIARKGLAIPNRWRSTPSALVARESCSRAIHHLGEFGRVAVKGYDVPIKYSRLERIGILEDFCRGKARPSVVDPLLLARRIRVARAERGPGSEQRPEALLGAILGGGKSQLRPDVPGPLSVAEEFEVNRPQGELLALVAR